ncbi:putative sulfate exporter family transporter, partial [Acinetobacter baumannii]
MSQNQASSSVDPKPATAVGRVAALIPGILLCILVAGISALLERAELGVFEHPYVEALVMAILLGMAVRSFWKPAPRWQ